MAFVATLAMLFHVLKVTQVGPTGMVGGRWLCGVWSCSRGDGLARGLRGEEDQGVNVRRYRSEGRDEQVYDRRKAVQL